MISWPPAPIIELDRIAFDSGGDSGSICQTLDPAVIPVSLSNVTWKTKLCLVQSIMVDYMAACPYPFQWGAPIFRAGDVFGMMGAALVTSAESTPTFYAASRLSSATPPPAHVLSRSIGLQGVSLLLDGILLQLALLPNLLREFGAFFSSIPLPIFAAIYCVLWRIVASTGISYIQFTNHNSLRNNYVLGLTLFLGNSIPYYFWTYIMSNEHGPVKTDGGWFDDILNTIFSSPATVALIVGALLDNTLEARDGYLFHLRRPLFSSAMGMEWNAVIS